MFKGKKTSDDKSKNDKKAKHNKRSDKTKDDDQVNVGGLNKGDKAASDGIKADVVKPTDGEKINTDDTAATSKGGVLVILYLDSSFEKLKGKNCKVKHLF